MKTFCIEEKVFGSILNCYTDCPYGKMLTSVEKDKRVIFSEEQKEYDQQTGMYLLVDTDDISCRIIWVKDSKSLSTIVHECIHAAQQCLDQKGISVDWDNKEIIAYLTEFYFKEFISALKKKK